MKITLDIDPTVLGTEVSEFIKTLTPEDKNNLVKQVVSEYYSDFRKFEDGEFKNKDSEWLETARSRMSSYDRPESKTDEEVRNSYYYQDLKKSFKTTAHITREEISNTLRSELSKNIQNFIKEDAGYQELLKQSMENVKEMFPVMVQQAMISHMANQLPNLVNQITTFNISTMDRLNNIENRLLR